MIYAYAEDTHMSMTRTYADDIWQRW